ncbi:uncharacterized protein LOC135489403 [Lineus longissimus]|uniref:uncharacterized protein LOC135489403 n=1 Tax=Lineus longissimus TaxID=88925 RepID=UPI00315CFB28
MSDDEKPSLSCLEKVACGNVISKWTKGEEDAAEELDDVVDSVIGLTVSDDNAVPGSAATETCESPVVCSGDGRDADDEESSSSGSHCADSEGEKGEDIVMEEGEKGEDIVMEEGNGETEEIENQEDGESQKSSGANALIYCDVCTIYCKGDRAYQSHVIGIFHAKQAAKKQDDLLAGGDGNEEKEEGEHDGGKFNCKLCSKSFLQVDTLKAHYRSLGHRKSLEAALKISGTVIEDICANLDLEDIKEPLLGIENVTEIYSFNSKRVLQYCCTICDCGSLRSNDLFPHLKGIRHQLNYMAKHYADWAKIIASEKNTTTQKELALKYAEEIIESKGRGQIIKVKLDDSKDTTPDSKELKKDTNQGQNRDRKPRGKMYSDLLTKDAAEAKARRSGQKSGDKSGANDRGKSSGRGGQSGRAGQSGRGGQSGRDGRMDSRNRGWGGQGRQNWGGDVRPLMSIPLPKTRDHYGPLSLGRGMMGHQGFNNRGHLQQQGRGRGLLMQQMGNQQTMNHNWGMMGNQQGMMGNQMMNQNIGMRDQNVGMRDQNMGMRDRRMPARDVRLDHGFTDWTRDDFSIGSNFQGMSNNNVMYNNDCYPGDLWEARGRGKRPNMPQQNNQGPGGDNRANRNSHGGYSQRNNEAWGRPGPGQGYDDRMGKPRGGGGRQGQQAASGKKQNEESNTKKKLLSMIGNMSESDAKVVLQVAGAVSKH